MTYFFTMGTLQPVEVSVMNEPVLCITVLFFLGWVIYLKLQISDLKREVAKLTEALKLKIKVATHDAEVS